MTTRIINTVDSAAPGTVVNYTLEVGNIFNTGMPFYAFVYVSFGTTIFTGADLNMEKGFSLLGGASETSSSSFVMQSQFAYIYAYVYYLDEFGSWIPYEANAWLVMPAQQPIPAAQFFDLQGTYSKL